MSRAMTAGLVLLVGMAGVAFNASAADAGKLRVVSDHAVTGFTFPESVGCDPGGKALYVSQFGGSELKPAEKDGNGRISKLSLDGKLVESRFLPDPGDVLNKPKGIWVRGNRLWVTDIDSIWIFDLMTRQGRKLPLPGVEFANDPAVKGNAVYISDNRSDQLVRVEPADFLEARIKPKITVVFSGKGVYPNGVYPAKDGSLLAVGFKSDKEPKGIYSVNAKGEIKELAKDIGRLDGVYELKDGTILATDWNSGSLFSWTAKDGKQTLASGFKGPADFCVIPQAKGYLVVAPDLVKSELRMIQLAK
jgi:sugar lactone lactonase YvrE